MNLDYYITKVDCPICKSPLFAKKDDRGVTVWCGQNFKVCPSIASNEGGHGRTEKYAIASLLHKLGFTEDSKSVKNAAEAEEPAETEELNTPAMPNTPATLNTPVTSEELTTEKPPVTS